MSVFLPKYVCHWSLPIININKYIVQSCNLGQQKIEKQISIHKVSHNSHTSHRVVFSHYRTWLVNNYLVLNLNQTLMDIAHVE